jgi:hypothetical protein
VIKAAFICETNKPGKQEKYSEKYYKLKTISLFLFVRQKDSERRALQWITVPMERMGSPPGPSAVTVDLMSPKLERLSLIVKLKKRQSSKS